MREGFAFVAFTGKGAALAERLRAELGGTVQIPGEGFSLSAWTAENFPEREALIFIGAAGIAVRAVAPHVRCKAEDPAVLCVDETGRFVIPLLSGHLGGANELARLVAALTGGTAVITTATDLNGAFAVDLWAKNQGMTVLQPERIRQVSAAVLGGETVRVYCPYPVAGERPAQLRCVDGNAEADVLVSFRKEETGALQLIPQVLTLGVGCRRGTGADTLERQLHLFCEERGIHPQAICRAATIDLKQDEDGLLRFCRNHGWSPVFYRAEELRKAEGRFTASAFVEAQTGVDNVCERAAVLCSGGGELAESKYAAEGVTFALAEERPEYDWSW